MQDKQLPSHAIRALIHNPEPSEPAITEALQYWSSGLLAEDHPDEPNALLTAFIELLNADKTIKWDNITLTGFLLIRILELTSNTLTNLPNQPASTNLLQASETFLNAANALSSTCSIPSGVIGDSLYAVLRINSSDPSHSLQKTVNQCTTTLCGQRSLKAVINANFSKTLPCVTAAVEKETSHTDPSTLLNLHGLSSSISVLYTLITTLDQNHLRRYAVSIYPVVHPLVEHVHQPTRTAGLDCLSHLHEHLGAHAPSTKFLRGSLLWADGESAKKAIPLLCESLRGIDDVEHEKCRKRVLATLKTLMTARDGRSVNVDATNTVVGLLKQPLCFGDLLLEHGVMWITSLSDFLSRVSRLAGEKRFDEMVITVVCEALKEAIRYCWILADGFRAKVMEGCLITVNEVGAEEVLVAVRGVLQVLSCCNPRRMVRMLDDIRETCSGYPSLSRTLKFLDTVRPLAEVECEKVFMGDMVTRFFPELNEF